MQMILFLGRKNSVPQNHLVLHENALYAENIFARNSDFIFIIRNSDGLSSRHMLA